MQIRFKYANLLFAFVNFKIYKSNKYVGWVGLAGGGGNIHWDNNMILPWKFY